MGRHTETITIEDEGRDKGKVFVITEMPAVAGERWASQLLKLLMTSGVKLPQNSEDAGMAGVAALADQQAVDPGLAVALLSVMQDPTLDSWWDCVRYQHKPNIPLQPIKHDAACQIEEIKTITQLRVAVLRLHTDFFSQESPSTTGSHSQAPTPTGSSPTRISRPRSGQ